MGTLSWTTSGLGVCSHAGTADADVQAQFVSAESAHVLLVRLGLAGMRCFVRYLALRSLQSVQLAQGALLHWDQGLTQWQPSGLGFVSRCSKLLLFCLVHK